MKISPVSSQPGYVLHWYNDKINADYKRVFSDIVNNEKLVSPPTERYHVWIVDPTTTEWKDMLEILTTGRLKHRGYPRRNQQHRGIILFTEVVDLGAPVADDSAAVSPPATKNEFMMRVLQSYGLARRLVLSHPPEEREERDRPVSNEEVLKTELPRFFGDLPEAADLQRELKELRDDFESIHEVARAELSGKDWDEVSERVSDSAYSARLMSIRAAGEEVAHSYTSAIDPDLSPQQFATVMHYVFQSEGYSEEEEANVRKVAPTLIGSNANLSQRDVDLLMTARTGDSTPPEVVRLIVELQRRLWDYELFRDFANWLVSGANAKFRRAGSSKVRVLILDEAFHLAKEGETQDNDCSRIGHDIEERLRTIRSVFKDQVEFSYVAASGLASHLKGHIESGEELRIEPLDDKPITAGVALLNYDVILVEVEFEGKFVGPGIVERLNAFLEREAQWELKPTLPGIVVLSQTANFAVVQQCLSLGAVAFVRKERLYELPAQVARARIKARVVESQGQKSNFRVLYTLPHEQIARLQNSASNNIIRGENDPPQHRRWLKDLPKADLHTHIGTIIDLETIQALAFNTVGHMLDRRAGNPTLAKAIDHLVDDVCDVVIRAAHINHALDRGREQGEEKPFIIHAAWYLELAFHGFGLPRSPYGDQPQGGDAEPGTRQETPYPDWLLEAEKFVKDAQRLPKDPGSPLKEEPSSPFARVVAGMHGRYHEINEFEMTALVVALLAVAEGHFRDEGSEPENNTCLNAILTRWHELAMMRDWLKDITVSNTQPRERPEEHSRWLINRRRRLEGLLSHIGDPVSWRSDALRGDTRVRHRLRRHGWDKAPELKGEIKETLQWLNERFGKVGPDSGAIETDAFRRLRAEFKRIPSGRKPTSEKPRVRDQEFQHCITGIARRVPFAWWKLSRRLAARINADVRSTEDLKSNFRGLTLEELVVVPSNPNEGDRTLLRYLWGADLLGADHLQYPENILLAARSIVEQSAKENVWYTELRCETAGYTQGGMVAVDATDLLCTALDLAVAHRVEQKVQGRATSVTVDGEREAGWVRVNILLGAKRHKPAERFQEMVGLAEYYMQQREDDDYRLSTFAPAWWKPTSVAGFDISGNENKKQARGREMMGPLFKHSTPISIHAGEAASAESIWEAVYMYGARRIGHGLRLRENRRLLNHCISEGICMELCPSSNAYTNSFPDVEDEYETDWWEYYPLRYYMEQGLDVSINTDNRQLHARGQNTLTAEYLRAARLGGGLTRWEVLHIVKSSFKHAFLSKREIGILIRAVESEVYELIAEGQTRAQQS